MGEGVAGRVLVGFCAYGWCWYRHGEDLQNDAVDAELRVLGIVVEFVFGSHFLSTRGLFFACRLRLFGNGTSKDIGEPVGITTWCSIYGGVRGIDL